MIGFTRGHSSIVAVLDFSHTVADTYTVTRSLSFMRSCCYINSMIRSSRAPRTPSTFNDTKVKDILCVHANACEW